MASVKDTKKPQYQTILRLNLNPLDMKNYNRPLLNGLTFTLCILGHLFIPKYTN